MNVYLLRHGTSEEKNPRKYPADADRPLSPEGEREIESAVRFMKALGLEFGAVFSSPYIRARKTAETVVRSFRIENRLLFSENLLPTSSCEELCHEINPRCSSHPSVLLVGHEPFLGRFASYLMTGRTRSCLELKKGGLCLLSAEPPLKEACATLKWLIGPPQTALFA